MPDGGGIAGYVLTGRTRASEVGTWMDAAAPDGGRAGALRFDPGLLSSPGATERVVAAVTADRRLLSSGLSGLLPVADLVAAREEIWLLTARPGTPSLAELMDGRPGRPSPDAGSAATVLVETAQVLLAVHAAGLAHGALHPGTVVVGDDGVAVLAERGLAAALLGEAASPERDVAAWAALARGLADAWAAGDPRAARLFDRAAATATSQGLDAARDSLLAGREVLPAGFITREPLVRSIQWWSASDVPTQSPPRPAIAQDEGEVVTLLYPPGAGEPPYGGGQGAHRVAAHGAPGSGPAGAAGFAGAGGAAGYAAAGADGTVPPAGTAETERAGDMRFGPGVPAGTTAAQIWRAGREQTTMPAKERLGAASAKRRRRRGGLLGSVVIFLLILTAALFLWFQRGEPLAVTAVEVKTPKAKGCDITVGVVGVITTNGSAGEVTYEWLPTGKKAIKHTDPVPSGKSTHEVTLEWEVGGEGSRKLTARLRVLSPTGTGKPLEDRASFTYKC
ncbi:hypothetical protein [Sphaerisporangium sp. TRM90804]|uniref:hypothetical protein n=1 Tax=Sphaerisporangium sp. TRM90804 TaxID=3031113 RepID=UPI00244A0A24|nr:hypothetical protein [Sphaerisporangium sp. TRM90804]MDH2429059.1 hypothetical protein [Sphaerisporangium sp. TRM90804]